MNVFKNKIVLITGGTGSLGEALLNRITDAREIRVLSRSEKNQIPMKIRFPEVKFFLGDVRDFYVVKRAMRDAQIIIHAAAFKFLNLAEEQVRECVLSNVMGPLNVVKGVSSEKSVEVVVGISTDKVSYARNVYGCTKHIMEKLFREASQYGHARFCCVRYGNVYGTTGSVIKIWEDRINRHLPITLTDPDMTRFFLTLDQAVDTITYAIEHTKGGEVFVRKVPSKKMTDLAKLLGGEVKITGKRPGEKIYETLIADYEGTEFTSDKALTYKDTGEIVTLYE